VEQGLLLVAAGQLLSLPLVTLDLLRREVAMSLAVEAGCARLFKAAAAARRNAGADTSGARPATTPYCYDLCMGNEHFDEAPTVQGLGFASSSSSLSSSLVAGGFRSLPAQVAAHESIARSGLPRV